MKQVIKSILLTVLMSIVGIKADAYDIEVDGFYYNYINDGTELAVAQGSYSGNIVIPEEVTYMNRTRRVTSIGDNAFLNNRGLTSVTIPNGVTSIGYQAFYGCSGLTSITIPNSVTSIGHDAFSGCYGLTSITISNSVTSIGYSAFSGCKGLTSITIPNSVKSIEAGVFYGCSGLTSVTIPNSVTSIDSGAFRYCTGLTSITIPNSVKSIGGGAFYGCSGLTSVTIGNSVTSIGNEAFFNCSGLTSVTIGNSVKKISYSAFSGCSGLTSVTIPNSVTSIDYWAFAGVDLTTVISLIENPFAIYGKTKETRIFTLDTFNNATLYVPKGTIDKYKATEGWKDFVFKEESGTPPIPEKCEKPTIGYMNGKLTFASSTEGATCQYSITDSDIKAGRGSEVQLAVTYNVSVYASKVGCENSETATATLCWIDATPQTEGITDGVAQISSKAVLIQSEGGLLKVEGVDDGTPVSVYTLDGKQAGSAVSRNGAALVGTNIQPGNATIVKIGNKSVKVIMK